MAKLTIAQLREKEVVKLAAYDRRQITEEEAQATAKRIMNRFYRYNALRIRNFEDDNNEATYNKFWHKQNEEKEERLCKKLNADINTLYGLNLTFAGLYAHIGEIDKENGCIKRDIISGWYY